MSTEFDKQIHFGTGMCAKMPKVGAAGPSLDALENFHDRPGLY